MTTYGLSESANAAANLYRVFTDGKPELLPLGIDEIDNKIGGVFKGTLVVLAMDTGVGKSRTALGAALHFGEVHAKPGERHGIISLEDGEDVVGARLLSWASGVDSLRIRTGDLDDMDVAALEMGVARLKELDNSGCAPRFAFRLGGSLEDIVEAVDELAADGCRVIWLDYLQKVRGVSDDRRNEVGTVLTSFQRQCARNDAVACVLSQFSRRQTRGEPQIHHLKESGDIENEARLILLGWEDEALTTREQQIVSVRVAKSTFGGQGMKFYRTTDASGLLVPHQPWKD